MIDYLKIISKITSKSERKTHLKKVALHAYTDESFFDFLDLLIREKLIIPIDWSGEETPSDIYNFLKNRLKKFDITLAINEAKIQNKLSSEASSGNIRRGDSVSFLVKYYQKTVSKLGFVIFDIFTGQDAYYLGICKKRNLTTLKRIEIPNNLCFLKFGTTRNKEVLYAIDCGKCGMSAMWQKEIEATPPKEGFCDTCGTNLFDEFGKPVYLMEKIPVP